MKPFNRLGPIFLVLALACAIGLGWNLRPNKYEGWIETTGTVVNHTHHRDYDRDRGSDETWGIVVRFPDEAGVEHEAESRTRSSHPKPIGATVDVRYPPGQPDRALIGFDSWFWVLFLGIWTLVLTILGLAFTFVGRRRRVHARPKDRPPLKEREDVDVGEKLEEREDTAEPTFEEPPFDKFRPRPGEPPADKWPRMP